MPTSKLRIIVTGLVAMHPIGGVAWDYLQYVIGLARLGHDVYYHEDTMNWPYHPLEQALTRDATYSAQYLRRFFERYAPDLQEHWHYLHLRETSVGMSRQSFDEIARTADLYINVSGASLLPGALSAQCVKVFLDTDPGYNQILLVERLPWSSNADGWWTEFVTSHDQHFTYAENIRSTDCLVPRAGIEWKPTRMPVVMDLWSQFARQSPQRQAPWTTVMTWNAFKGPLLHGGVEYLSKSGEFDKIIDLPARKNLAFKIALGGVNAPYSRLTAAGWEVLDGPEATLTPSRYCELISNSRGEVSTAKHVYVAMRTGWFSCRSACYLAAGRPVVVQDTGFSEFLPSGEGVLTFSTTEEAVQAIEIVEADYDRHHRSAVEYAEGYFSSTQVLSRLLKDAGS